MSAYGQIAHNDVEFGFVVTPGKNSTFCRFFYSIEGKETPKLRTRANSEAVPNTSLRKFNFVNQRYIDGIMEGLGIRE